MRHHYFIYLYSVTLSHNLSKHDFNPLLTLSLFLCSLQCRSATFILHPICLRKPKCVLVFNVCFYNYFILCRRSKNHVDHPSQKILKPKVGTPKKFVLIEFFLVFFFHIINCIRQRMVKLTMPLYGSLPLLFHY